MKAKQNDDLQLVLEQNAALLAAKQWLPAVRAFVLANSGSAEDAEDLLHDAVLVVYQRAREGRLEISAPWGAYLFGICKNQWLHRLRDRKRRMQVTKDRLVEHNGENREDTEWQQVERYRLYIEKLEALGGSCRQLLELVHQKLPLKEVAATLGYTYDFVRQKKGDCIAALTKLIRQDPRYQELR